MIYFNIKDKNKDLSMNKNDFSKMGDMGIRFILFRKAIKKTRTEIADELSVGLWEIKAVENGKRAPKIDYLHYLSTEYGLDINWILGGLGAMFTGLPPRELDENYVRVPAGEQMLAKYVEIFQLMQIPAIKKSILEWLEEFKEQLRKKS